MIFAYDEIRPPSSKKTAIFGLPGLDPTRTFDEKQRPMNTYQRIEKAIQYLHTHFREQPGLDEVAEQAHLSTFHFQRLFTEWAGVSPKKFLQFLSLNYAKTATDNASLVGKRNGLRNRAVGYQAAYTTSSLRSRP